MAVQLMTYSRECERTGRSQKNHGVELRIISLPLQTRLLPRPISKGSLTERSVSESERFIFINHTTSTLEHIPPYTTELVGIPTVGFEKPKSSIFDRPFLVPTSAWFHTTYTEGISTMADYPIRSSNYSNLVGLNFLKILEVFCVRLRRHG